jgi:ketosteroid isomerase-like protein
MRFPVFPVLAVLAVACAPVSQQGQTDQDYAAIDAARASFIEAVNAGDMTKAAGIYADDAVVMPSNMPAVRGRLAVQEMLGGYPPIGDFRITVTETKGGAGLVTVRGQYSMNLMPPGATAAVADTGKFVEVWAKQGDGSWKMIWDIWNTDIAPPAPAGQ